jgi:pyridoxal phosphate enzyme (YggS family)
MVNTEAWNVLHSELSAKGVTLVAVSKTKPNEDIQEMYALGQRDFGENYVQELVDKETALPKDICWHYIGHLQSNKVKFIAPFVHLIHAVDSAKLLSEINKQAEKNNRVIDVLLQMHIADEETKFGMDEGEVNALIAESHEMKSVRICGLMGMATNTEDENKIRAEYKRLKQFFDTLAQDQFKSQAHFNTCSIGMSGDYEIAIEEGSNMVRIGSLLFGERNYTR